MLIQFHIYFATKTRWAHLTKNIDIESVPRVNDYVKFNNKELGDYFAYKVIEVEYHENGTIHIMTELVDNIDNRMFSFEEESEFDEYFDSYIAEGWQCPRGPGPNRRYLNS